MIIRRDVGRQRILGRREALMRIFNGISQAFILAIASCEYFKRGTLSDIKNHIRWWTGTRFNPAHFTTFKDRRSGVIRRKMI
jgi:hypothetical protein